MVLAGLMAYIAVVHTVDTLAATGAYYGLDWTLFSWQGRNGFDWFKFLAWLVVPLAALTLLRRMDWGYFGFRRLRRADAFVLTACAVVGMGAVLLILVVPSLQQWYHGMGDLPAAVRWRFALHRLSWTASWLIGWEFIHRYALLTQAERVWPRCGWLLLPLVEGLYHVQKAPIEMVGMVAFSAFLTLWTRRRQNIWPALLAHLLIELELLAFQLVAS